MPRWPLLLPPPAVSISTSPSRSRGSSSSIVIKVESPLCRPPSPSSCRHGCAVPRRCAAPSIILYSPLRRPSPPIAFVLSVHRRRARAVEAPSRRPSPSRSRCAVHCRRGAACRLTTPATRHAPPRPLVRMVVALPLLTPPPSICRRLSLRHHLSCLSSVWLVVTSPRFSRRHLPSAGASASHRTVTSSCHAHLGPLVRALGLGVLTPHTRVGAKAAPRHGCGKK